MNKILIGDVYDVLPKLPRGSVDCCITSPPYFKLRDYDHPHQIGTEDTPEQFVHRLMHAFRMVRDVLRDDGTLWIVIGDTWNTYPGNRGRSNGINKNSDRARPAAAPGSGLTVKGLKNKDMIGIPWMLAFALRADGWYLRSDIIWAKPNPMPGSYRDRPTYSHEHILLLSKSAQYHCDMKAIAEPSKTNDPRRPYGARGAWKVDGRSANQRHGGEPRTAGDPTKRNKRDVWSVPVKPYQGEGEHPATYSEELITPCILAGSRSGGIVLDPFVGSGTTSAAAKRLGRQSIGIELNASYAAAARKRISTTPVGNLGSDGPR